MRVPPPEEPRRKLDIFDWLIIAGLIMALLAGLGVILL